MESLRERQRREVVDEDANISKRVFAMNEKQVQAFNETVLPKKTRDIESEISIDKLIEGLNRILEQKQVSLETLLTRAGDQKSLKGDSFQAYTQLVSNGDVVALFNQITRIYTAPGLSRASLESIKVKLQDLKPNIDAIDYGLGEAIQLFFEGSINDKQISRLLQSQAVYRTLKNQLSNNVYQPITISDIEISAKEILSELSENQRKNIQPDKEVLIQDRTLLNLPIQLGQNKQRIEALESELGFQIPEDLKQKADELLPRQLEDVFRVSDDKSIVESRKTYDERKKKLENEKNALQFVIPSLVSRLKTYTRQLGKQRAYMDSLPEEKGGEYSTKLAGEEEKYNRILESVYELRRSIDEKKSRQGQIVDEENQLRKWYEERELEKMREFKVPKRRFKKTEERESRLISPSPKPKPRGRARMIEEEDEEDEQKYGGMMYDDERNDVYKMKGL